ncbi:MAG: FHA domain-containing protein [Blastopirellula sp. JB062]
MTATYEIHSANPLQGDHRRSAPLRAELHIRRGRAQKSSRLITAPLFLIGSGNDCDLVLGDPQFPEAYAYVYHRGSQLTLRWLDEGPELTVNGEHFTRGAVADGDRIRCGPYEFQVAVAGGGGAKEKQRSLQQIVGKSTATEESAREEVEMLLAEVKRNLFGDQFAEEDIPSHWRRASA